MSQNESKCNCNSMQCYSQLTETTSNTDKWELSNRDSSDRWVSAAASGNEERGVKKLEKGRKR